MQFWSRWMCACTLCYRCTDGSFWSNKLTTSVSISLFRNYVFSIWIFYFYQLSFFRIISLLVMLCIFWAIANYGHQTKTQKMDDSLKSEC